MLMIYAFDQWMMTVENCCYWRGRIIFFISNANFAELLLLLLLLIILKGPFFSWNFSIVYLSFSGRVLLSIKYICLFMQKCWIANSLRYCFFFRDFFLRDVVYHPLLGMNTQIRTRHYQSYARWSTSTWMFVFAINIFPLLHLSIGRKKKKNLRLIKIVIHCSAFQLWYFSSMSCNWILE